MTRAYYNEIDPYCAQWLRNLIDWGIIAPGDVDERSIEDVLPSELRGYTQCHFFAGIGVWSYALRQAGGPDDRRVWTGSCPCQPFSAAGKGGGFADERHLWPAWFHLIGECRPDVVFGEQVASKDGLGWLDLVQADMEASGYAFGAVDTCAAGFGAPHIRQRLYFVGDASSRGARRYAGAASCAEAHSDSTRREDGCVGNASQPTGTVGRQLGNANDTGPQGRRVSGADRERLGAGERAAGAAGTTDRELADDEARRRSEVEPLAAGGDERASAEGRERSGDSDRPSGMGQPDGTGREPWELASEAVGHGRSLVAAGGTSFWSACDWLPCIDGKARPVEPGTFPLVNGTSARVGRLRAYGNAIVAAQAQGFVEAYLEACGER